MDYVSVFITLAGISILAAVLPGPDFIIVSRNSLRYGRLAGLATAVGVGTGILVHVSYSLIGIGLIISRSILLFNTIKLAGAAYIIYLGIKSLISKSQTIKIEEEHAQDAISGWKAFSMGFLTNGLNPKVTLFFLGIFTQVIDPNTPMIIQWLLGVEVALIVLAWFSFLGIILSTKLIRGSFGGIMKYFEKIFGVVLVALGVKVALSSR